MILYNRRPDRWSKTVSNDVGDMSIEIKLPFGPGSKDPEKPEKEDKE
jgi:hypothetical protein